MTHLKQLIQSKKTVWAAGAFDALSARLIQEAGFDALLTSGYGVSSSFLGEPDTEFYTMTENLSVVRNVCNAVTIPVIADIDTAYGNAVSAMRTMREFENAGASAVIVEDQVSPKRCPCSSDQIDIVPMEDHIGKIRAMVAARKNPDVLIIARTDAVDGAEAVRRGRAYVAAGADIIQPISKCFKDFAGLKAMREGCGVPLSLQLLAWLETDLNRQQIEEVAAIATYPLVALMSATQAMRTNLRALAETKSSRQLPLAVTGLHDFNNFIGFPRIDALQKQYMGGEQA
ncbi:2,3-dimethylmalate lyase (plasmid) [Variovorax sp. SRS16]|uniref:isocitrate lyase/PEP mutase family protein n=1 Tax=Variovorax sp. SRS16 TaxID=282217 RepID=UPI001315C7FF|nr:isocitrate lyase/PEP mutase family protein [Variovorax sp. SRS16]VTU46527.1 2,3-dimethylmalate lyase [Variovorax sp. SRS16]